MKFFLFFSLSFIFLFNSDLFGAQYITQTKERNFQVNETETSNPQCDRSVSNLSSDFSLKNLVSGAMCNNPDIKKARDDIEGAKLDFEAVDAKYASEYQFRLNNNTQFGDTTAIENIINTSGQADIRSDADRLFLTLKWTLPWWYKSEFKYEAAKNRLGIDIAVVRYQRKIQDTVLQVYKAYIALLLQHQKQLIANQRMEIALKDKAAAEKNLELGRISDLETILEESDYINQQIATDDAIEAMESKKAELSGLVGLPITHPADLSSNSISFSKFDAGKYKVDDAILFQTREIQIQLAQQALEIDKHKDVWKPEISSWVGYSPFIQSVGGNSSQQIDNLVTIGLEIKVSFPNFSASSAAVKVANHESLDLANHLNMMIKQTHEQSDQLIHKINRLSQQLALIQKLKQVKERQFQAAKKRFELGEMSEYEFKTHQIISNDVEVQYFEKLTDYLVTQAELNRLYGLPIVKDLKIDTTT